MTEVGGSFVAGAGSSGDLSVPTMQGVLYQGTAVDGWWKLTITFPQGTPPGAYPLGQIWVADKAHWRSYTPPGSPYLGDSGRLSFASGTVQTTDGAAWDGVITGVNNRGAG